MPQKPRKRTSASTMTVAEYDAAQERVEATICKSLRGQITRTLPKARSMVWHGSPVWFIGETPVLGYSVPAKGGVSLLFWNGMAFDDPALERVGKFKAAQIHYGSTAEIKLPSLRRWLKLAGTKIWDLEEIRTLRVRRKAAR